MSLIDKMTEASGLPPETDLLAFLGWQPGDPFKVSRDGLTVGGETVPLDAARLALAGGAVPQTPGPRRAITIGDL
jgi:hypothetical protein